MLESPAGSWRYRWSHHCAWLRRHWGGVLISGSLAVRSLDLHETLKEANQARP